MNRTALARFLSKVEKAEDGCWLWGGSVLNTGYGSFRRGDVTGSAHRAAYELLVGRIPDGLQLDHLCRVRHCVNPAHLEPVTAAENIRRQPRRLATHCQRGHAFTPENTDPYEGRRRCRTCRINRQHGYRLNRAA